MADDDAPGAADEDIRLLAYDIATTQSSQKGEFYDWLVR